MNSVIQATGIVKYEYGLRMAVLLGDHCFPPKSCQFDRGQPNITDLTFLHGKNPTHLPGMMHKIIDSKKLFVIPGFQAI